MRYAVGVLVVVVFAAAVYGYFAGSRWIDRAERDEREEER